MNIRVGVISSQQFFERLQQISTQVGGLELVPYLYEKPSEAKGLVQQVTNCDVLFFAGLLPLYIAEEETKKLTIPHTALPLQDLNVIVSIFYILYHHQVELSKLSIDIVDKKTIDEVLAELKLQEMPCSIIDYIHILEQSPEDFGIERIFEHHYRLFKEGRITFVLTSIHAVAERLKEAGIPCTSIIDPEKSLISGLEHAKALGELERSKLSQTAVALVSVTNMADSREHDIFGQEAHLHLQQILHHFAKRFASTLQHVGGQQYVIYSTRGSVEHLTEQLTTLPFLHEAKQELDAIVSVGFGFGMTIRDAEKNAKTALDLARGDAGSNSAYVVTSEKKVIGPLNSQPKQYFVQTQNEALLKAAKEANISISNLHKIIAFQATRTQKGFTSQDLAEYLEVSRRSAERLLKKLLEKHYVKIIGEETPYQKGRPRAVYQLQL
ncbi:HTH domain-containing protein [Bacillus tianshenii]|nr:HTH domain-containing protein [Bacillus tianshenii]